VIPAKAGIRLFVVSALHFRIRSMRVLRIVMRIGRADDATQRGTVPPHRQGKTTMKRYDARNACSLVPHICAREAA
jgi:hypothetical protein